MRRRALAGRSTSSKARRPCGAGLARFGEGSGHVDEVCAAANPDTTASIDAVRNGKASASPGPSAQSRRPPALPATCRPRRSESDHVCAPRWQLGRKISGAARARVEHAIAGAKRERRDRAPAPSAIDAERHQAVHQVVTRSDAIEHRLDDPRVSPHRGKGHRPGRSLPANAEARFGGDLRAILSGS